MAQPGSRADASPRGRAGGALGRVLGNLGRGLRDCAIAPIAAATPRDWVVLRLDQGVSEVAPAGWLASWVSGPRPLSELLEALGRARDDARVRGVLVRVGGAGIGWSKVTALARALSRLREAGVKLAVYAESTGNAGAWLGALADRFWMAPEGRLELLGVRVESFFVRRALDRLGVRPQVLAAGRYKSAAEIISRESMSKPAREALEALVEDLYSTLVDGLAAGKAGSAERAREWIDAGPYLAPDARDAGIVDDLVYPDEIPARLAELAGGGAARAADGPEARMIGHGRYLRLARPRFVWNPVLSSPTRVAVVTLQGTIRAGSASPRGIVGVLRRLERQSQVAAVVLRVDSPGGDPLASDLIWRTVSKLTEKKPVVASLGDRAASGGYYVAMAACEIVSEPTTLTGSIGVILAGVELGGLADAAGVDSDAVQRGRHAGIYDPLRRRTSEERDLLRRQVHKLYDDFVVKAAADRGLAVDELRKVAEGRVWSGLAACEKRLVDRLGGLDDAVLRAGELAGLEPGEARRLDVPIPTRPLERLLRGSPLGFVGRALRAVLDPTASADAAPRVSGAQMLCPIRISLR